MRKSDERLLQNKKMIRPEYKYVKNKGEARMKLLKVQSDTGLHPVK